VCVCVRERESVRERERERERETDPHVCEEVKRTQLALALAEIF
jgi:hypothetical protein